MIFKICKKSRVLPRLFTISWEQRKVSELFRVTRGYVLAATQTETTKTDEKPYPVYSSQTKDKGLMGYYKDYLYEDAITWTTDGANAGTVNYRTGKFYCTNVCGVLLSNEVKANQMIAEALNNVAKGYVSYVGNPKLMNNVMADIVIQIPTQAEEREQLSSYFASLDNLITLHQRELHMYTLCCSYLSKALGHLITIYWEQRKLGELGEILTGSTPSTSHKEYYSDNGIPWVTPTDISKNIIYDTPRKLSDKGREIARIAPKGTILVTCIASIGKNTMLGTMGSFNQQINALIPNFEKNNPYFLLTESMLWSEKMKQQAAAGTMQIVNKTEFSELVTMVPKLEEQEAIGTYFRNLDHLITLHQRKSPHERNGGTL